MAKHRKNAKPTDEKRPSGESLRADDARGPSFGRTGRPPKPPRRGSLTLNRSDIRFLVIFGLCMGLYYLVTLLPPVEKGFFPAYLRLNAAVSGTVLRVFGMEVTVRDQALVSADGPSIEVARGCDAVAPSALFVSAVLASPVPLLSRLAAAAAGTAALMLLNLLRIISLFLVRIHWPRAFEAMHLDVWQALFIFLALVFWAAWASRASRKLGLRGDVST